MNALILAALLIGGGQSVYLTPAESYDIEAYTPRCYPNVVSPQSSAVARSLEADAISASAEQSANAADPGRDSPDSTEYWSGILPQERVESVRNPLAGHDLSSVIACQLSHGISLVNFPAAWLFWLTWLACWPPRESKCTVSLEP